jgi:pyruvate ferredoxin oxidoreductase gamma subunit
MTEVRIHGRGGQGNVVAAYLLATAAFEAGRYGQAFPAFGAERRGAPVVAFVRIEDRPIQRRCQVRSPDFVVVQDAGLLREPHVTDGLRPGGLVIANSPEPSEVLAARLGCAVLSISATALSQEVLGKPVPNVALLAALLRVTGLLPLESLERALAERFRDDVLTRNAKLIARVAALELAPAGWVVASGGDDAPSS